MKERPVQVIGTIIFLVVVALTIFQDCNGENNINEDIDIVMSVDSPNKEHTATIFTISGGGAAGYLYQCVNLRKAADKFDSKKGLIFQAVKVKDLSVEWQGKNTLKVIYSKVEDIFTKKKEWGNEGEIIIEYVTTQ